MIDIIALYASNQPMIGVITPDVGGSITALAAAQEAERFRNEAEAFRNESETFSELTNSDRLQTELDRLATGEDRVATGEDRVQTGLDRIATAADRVQTGLDVIATGEDRVATGQDKLATAADRAAVDTAKNQTLDFKNLAETAAFNATQAAQLADQYKTAAEAAKIQTELDAVATAEDRQVVEAYVGDINNLVTTPFARFAADLIRTQTIVVEHHGFI